MKTLQIFFLKITCGIVLASDNDSTLWERIAQFFYSFKFLGPVVFLAGVMNTWYMTNQKFTWAVIIMVFINAGLGVWMHLRKKSFNAEEFLVKTVKMIVILGVTYLVLEMVINVGGENIITNGFRAALQMSTLLYPGSKILKNVFILSNGEYPYRWIMDKLYNFEKNGDLNELFKKPTV